MSKIGVKIEEVKMVVEQNINRVLQNAEDLEAVETKSEILRQDAAQFQRRGENIKRALWWRNFKVSERKSEQEREEGGPYPKSARFPLKDRTFFLYGGCGTKAC